ncbi:MULTISPECIES: hypothetical protein [unclassified Archaeoglobus]|jgi:hypothetical protein|nr:MULTISPECIES: hypothetical protein [unclassified Archaeoglobus]
MKALEGLIVVLAMLIPFIAIKSYDMATYTYWTLISATYLCYIAVARW